jgi:SIR2-like domain
MHDAHYKLLVPMLLQRQVIPLLGAGANRCGRPDSSPWREGHDLPDGHELAHHLAEQGKFPSDEAVDLVRVSQFIAVKLGSGALYDRLHEVFDHPFTPTPLHRFLAGLPAARRRRDLVPGHVVVTTNYDDSLERAFADAGEPYDVVSYIADGADAGRFMHRPHGAPAHVIDVPNEYSGLAIADRSVILKLHGAVDRADPMQDSFVITEDDYIAYLTRTDISGLLPVTLSAELTRRHFLFLGYSLRDWNLRVILHRIWGRQRRRYNSWAVQLRPDELDCAFWEERKVEIHDVALDDYVAALARELDAGTDDGPPALAAAS